MRARFTRRALVLVLLGVFLCALVWIVTTETGPYRTNIGKLSATLEPSNGLHSKSARVALTNCGAGDLQLLGIVLQFKESDGTWRECSSTGVSVTLLPGASHVVAVNGIKESGEYRPWVSYSCELTGLRRLTNRFSRAVKKRNLGVLWESSTTYRHGEAVGKEFHF